MSENHLGELSTLLGLIDRHGGVRIPMIQRDYAQGRKSWANPRRRFLDDLANALVPSGEPLHMDFIYGVKLQEDGIPAFCPLDGQQRLTTLFLLHWYLAARDGRFADFQDHFRAKASTSLFSYQVRPGGRAFFDSLIKHLPPTAGGFPGGSPSKWFHEVPWFRTAWKNDPTVAGVLSMLDAMHERFCNDKKVSYAQLLDGNSITFHLLDLGEIGLHDDLYLRMNARGRALSTFETFKARYEKHLKKQFPQAADLARCKVQSSKAFSEEIDGAWMDFIWGRCFPKQEGNESEDGSDDTSKVDIAFMNLFRAIALVSLGEKSKDEFTKDVNALTKKWPDFDEFEQGGWLNHRYARHLIHLLETWSNKEIPFPLLGSNPFFDEASFFDQIATGSTKPSLADYLQFAAYVRFITHHGPYLSGDMLAMLREWMRVIRNLAVNADLEADMFGNQLDGLDELVKDSRHILAYLCGDSVRIKGFNQQQVAEERLKAKLLRTPQSGWHDLILQAESHPYFKGQIGFLLDFSGIFLEEIPAWDADEHILAQSQFREFLTKAERMFNGKGLADMPRCLWERALLSIGDYLYPNPNGFNKSLLRNERNLAESWKRLLQGADDDAKRRRTFLKELWESINLEDDLAAQLESIIQKHEGACDWRSQLIHSPASIEFCSQRWIRKYSETSVYILRSSQMNGYNAELFTHSLWDSEGLSKLPEKFHPLRSIQYAELKGANEDTSHIFFHWILGEKELPVHLYCNTDGIPGFSLWIKTAELDEEPQLQIKSQGFKEHGDWHYLVPDSPGDPYNGMAFLRKCSEVLGSIPIVAIPHPG